jgi:hypothetical protein
VPPKGRQQKASSTAKKRVIKRSVEAFSSGCNLVLKFGLTELLHLDPEKVASSNESRSFAMSF